MKTSFSSLVLIILAIGVNETYGQLASGGNQFWNQDANGILGVAGNSDNFGNSVANGDFNGDGFDDLAIGVRYEDVGTAADGAVNVLYGSATGFTDIGNQIWDQDQPGILGTAEQLDFFGWSLAAGDFNGDGFDDLAIGVPYEDVGSSSDAGAVNVLYGSSAGLTDAGNQLWDQDSPGILNLSQVGDKFGSSLSAGDFDGDGYDDLAIGVPGEAIGTIGLAGGVNVIYGSATVGLSSSGNQFWSQNSSGILDIAELSEYFGSSLSAGDFDGDGYDDLAIGILFEGVGTIDDAGAASVIYGSVAIGLSSSGNQLWSQNSPGILNTAADLDEFGYSLAAGDFDGDGYDDLAIGVIHEDISTIVDAGGVNVIYGSATVGLSSSRNQFWSQNSTGILNQSQPDDNFGWSLTVGDFNGDGYGDLAIGVPDDELGTIVDAGGVNVIYGAATVGLSSSGNQFWTQNSPGILNMAETSDIFGLSLAAGDFDEDDYDDLGIGVPLEDITNNTIVDAGSVNVIYGSGPGEFAKGEHEVLSGEDESTPVEFSLKGNYPNPFNPTTTIAYSIGEVGPVRLTVYNTLGQLVATLVDNPSHPEGEFTASFNASGLASGVYLYRLEAAGATEIKKMMLLK